jgi:hypothetical protein
MMDDYITKWTLLKKEKYIGDSTRKVTLPPEKQIVLFVPSRRRWVPKKQEPVISTIARQLPSPVVGGRRRLGKAGGGRTAI